MRGQNSPCWQASRRDVRWLPAVAALTATRRAAANPLLPLFSISSQTAIRYYCLCILPLLKNGLGRVKNKNQRKLHQHKDSVSQAAWGSAEVQVEEVSRQFPRMETCLLNPPCKETERFFQRGACSVFSIVYLEGCDMQRIEIATSSETDLSFYFCFDQLLTFWLCVTLHMSIFNMQKARGWESSASLQVFIPAKTCQRRNTARFSGQPKGSSSGDLVSRTLAWLIFSSGSWWHPKCSLPPYRCRSQAGERVQLQAITSVRTFDNHVLLWLLLFWKRVCVYVCVQGSCSSLWTSQLGFCSQLWPFLKYYSEIGFGRSK